jgi:surface antigen
MKYLLASSIGMLAMVVLVAAQAAEDTKYTNKEVMQKAMKGGLLNKVKSGKASDDEKKLLVDLMTALHDNVPKKGDPDNWKKMTDALVAAAKSGDAKALATAANCMACHKEFKGK